MSKPGRGASHRDADLDDALDGDMVVTTPRAGTRTPRGDYVPKDEYLAFAAALRRYRLASKFPTQARLAEPLGVSWHAVGTWEKGVWAPAPEKVFEVERLLALPPGTLSRHLGYLPLRSAQPGVQAAIDADPRLDEKGKQLLTEMYRALAGKRPAASRARDSLF